MSSSGMGYSTKVGGNDYSDLRGSRSAGGGGPSLAVGADFPFVCETCLGPNPYVRMIKMRYGSKTCKISDAPYQPFRWRAGAGSRGVLGATRVRQRCACRSVSTSYTPCPCGQHKTGTAWTRISWPHYNANTSSPQAASQP